MKVLFLFSLICSSIVNLSNCVVVQTEYGPVDGSFKSTENEIGFYSFQKIPYAKSPVGELRFRAPQPPDTWSTPLNCSVEGPAFLSTGIWPLKQFTTEPTGVLDSLHLNVFSNDLNPSTKYPVMVWIHGGGFNLGSSSTKFYGPEYLVERDVVIVTFNYRLGAFGFLSFEDSKLEVPGNAGLKDQRFALQWVQRNIANFGGDPSRVTLFGQSSGASSTHFHMISDESKGLFHKAIIMSGTAFVGRQPRLSQASKITGTLSAGMGYWAEFGPGNLNYLESQKPKDIVEAAAELFGEAEYDETFGPTAETYDTTDVFINEKMLQSIANAWGNEIPLIIGATSLESLDRADRLQRDSKFFNDATNFQNYIPKKLNIKLDSEKAKEYAQMIKEKYYGNNEPSMSNTAGLMNVYSDSTMWLAIKQSIEYRLKDKKAPTFVYRFDANTENCKFRKYLTGVDTFKGAMHGEDFTHLFKTYMHGPLSKLQADDYKTMQFMVSSFTSFATNGDPSVPELNVKWPAVDDDEVLMGLNINETISHVLVFPESERLQVFEEIYALEAERDGAATLLTLGLVKLSLLTIASRFLL